MLQFHFVLQWKQSIVIGMGLVAESAERSGILVATGWDAFEGFLVAQVRFTCRLSVMEPS